MDINLELLQLFIIVLIKRLQGVLLCLEYKSAVKNENMSNKELSEELHKPIIRKFKEIKVKLPFTENTWDIVCWFANLIKELVFYDVVMMFSVNRHELFFWKIRKELKLLRIFKIS